MATGTWVPGYNRTITFLGVNLKVKGGSFTEMVEKLIVTHNQSGGVQGWLAGILDGQGSIQANVDAGAVPPAFGLVAGVSGFLTYSLGSTNPYVIPVTVERKNYQWVVNGLLEYSFDVSVNSEVGSMSRAA